MIFKLFNVRSACVQADITECGTLSYKNFPLAENKIHDRLLARVLLFSSPKGEAVWISADECTFRRAAAKRIKELVEVACDIKAEKILLCATHTHAAHGYKGFLADAFAQKIIAAIVEARKHLRPISQISERIGVIPETNIINRRAHLGPELGDHCVMFNTDCTVNLESGTIDVSKQIAGFLESLGTTARHEGFPEKSLYLTGSVDSRIHIWTIRDTDNKAIAAVARVNAHPAAVSQSRVGAILSADYIRSFCEIVEHAQKCPCLVFNGAFGDTRPLNKDYTFEEADRIGSSWAKAGLDGPEYITETSSLQCISNASLTLQIRRDLPKSKTEIEAQLAILRQTLHQGTAVERKRRQEKMDALRAAIMPAPPLDCGGLLPDELESGYITCEVQAWKLGPISLVCLPGEPFVKVSQTIEAACGGLVVGIANGYIGYLPDETAIKGGSYEATECYLEPTEIAHLCEYSSHLMNQLH
jgi:hypothetical protein